MFADKFRRSRDRIPVIGASQTLKAREDFETIFPKCRTGEHTRGISKIHEAEEQALYGFIKPSLRFYGYFSRKDGIIWQKVFWILMMKILTLKF